MVTRKTRAPAEMVAGELFFATNLSGAPHDKARSVSPQGFPGAIVHRSGASGVPASGPFRRGCPQRPETQHREAGKSGGAAGSGSAAELQAPG